MKDNKSIAEFKFKPGLPLELEIIPIKDLYSKHKKQLILPHRTPSGHTMIDGPTTSTDAAKTEENKKFVRQFVDDILVNGKMDKLAGYFHGDNYIQHNSQIPDQLSGLGKTLGELAKQGITLKYDKIHKVLGQGNFVLVVSEGNFGKSYNAFYDLFRVENGKIAEHWDVIEQIPAKESWKNDNGKFGF